MTNSHSETVSQVPGQTTDTMDMGKFLIKPILLVSALFLFSVQGWGCGGTGAAGEDAEPCPTEPSPSPPAPLTDAESKDKPPTQQEINDFSALCVSSGGVPRDEGDEHACRVDIHNNGAFDQIYWHNEKELGEAEKELAKYKAAHDRCPSKVTRDNSGSYICPEGNTSSTEDDKSKCQAAIDSAITACDENNDSGWKKVGDSANLLVQGMSASVNSNPMMACSGLGSLVTSANAALAALKATCSTYVSDCQTACRGSDVSSRQRCQQAGARVNGLGINAMQAFNSTQLQGCAQLQSAMGMTAGALAMMCQSNPTNPQCQAMDCKNPMMASSPVCRCASNPSDPICNTVMSSSGSSSPPLNLSNTGSGTDSGGGAGVFPSLSLGDNSGDISFASQSPKDESLGGRRGGGGGAGLGSLGGGGGEPSARSGGRGGGSNINTSLYKGSYGSGGGGAFGGGSGGSSYGNSSSTPGQKQANVDLSQFLPGGKMDPSRGLAGVAGPDGITGPGSDLFRKVNLRYGAVQQRRELLP